jgi:hypothetical protein
MARVRGLPSLVFAAQDLPKFVPVPVLMLMILTSRRSNFVGGRVFHEAGGVGRRAKEVLSKP